MRGLDPNSFACDSDGRDLLALVLAALGFGLVVCGFGSLAFLDAQVSTAIALALVGFALIGVGTWLRPDPTDWLLVFTVWMSVDALWGRYTDATQLAHPVYRYSAAIAAALVAKALLSRAFAARRNKGGA